MRYELPIFRPPSEAFSLILQITIGCSHNACTFCGAYRGKKFRVKTWDEIEQDIAEASIEFKGINRIFLADGDALAVKTDLLLKILDRLYSSFPGLERVGIYAGPKDILAKSESELSELRRHGLKILYMGLESGSDRILKDIRKGVTAAQMVEAGKKALAAGFDLSVTIITGLGGQELWEEHAVETARIASAIDPTYLASLTLIVVPGTPLEQKVKRGEFKLLTPWQTLQELKLLIENLSLTNCVYRANHASNYLPLKGVLNRDKKALLSLLNKALEHPDEVTLRPEYARGL